MTGPYGVGGLNPVPVNAPQGVAPASGVQPGQSTAVVVANKVIVFGPNDGVFVYSGTPAFGNPPIFWAGSGPNDPYGNPLPSTSGVNGTGTFEATDGVQQTVIGASSLTNSGSLRTVALSDGQLVFGGLVAAFVTSPAKFTVGAIAPNPAACQWQLPFLQPLTPVQPLTATTAETWHNMTLLAGFAAGGQTPRYTLKPDNTVMLAGSVTLTANQAAATAFWAAPTGYVATVSSFYATTNSLSGYALGGASVKVEAGGAGRINVAGTAGNSFTLDGIRYPLD